MFFFGLGYIVFVAFKGTCFVLVALEGFERCLEH